VSNVRRGLLQRSPARDCFGIRGTVGGVRWDLGTYVAYLGQPACGPVGSEGGCGEGSDAGSASVLCKVLQGDSLRSTMDCVIGSFPWVASSNLKKLTLWSVCKAYEQSSIAWQL